jgi:SAM-dependent methyltransferase
MKRRLLEDLVCPLSRHPLFLDASGDDEGDVLEGALACRCGERWPIRNGVPRLVPSDLADQQEKTASAFGWQWQHFSELHPEFEAQFFDWLHPLEPGFFQGKRVLDAGCGTGRHAQFAAKYGASEVVALDLSAAVEAARDNLAHYENVHVVQGDLLRPPFRTPDEGGGFDLIYSIGVLHHLPDPQEGFRSLVRFLRPGGTIAVWVYGHENNGVVRNVVEPLRRVSTKIPPSGLRLLAWPLGAAFHGLAKGVYGPLAGSRVGSRLPLSQYMASVADFTFRQNYAIVFDQLVAPTAAYIKGPELDGWFADAGLAEIMITHRHENSWRGRGRLPSGGGPPAGLRESLVPATGVSDTLEAVEP